MNAPERMNVSVVIVTFRRTAWLRRCITSLLEAAALEPSVRLTIHVGINGAIQDSETEVVLEILKNKIEADQKNHLRPTQIQPIEVLKSAQRKTPATIRNSILEQVTADWIFFIDDDAYVESDHFRHFCYVRAVQPTAAVVGGPNLTAYPSNAFQRASGLALASRMATGFTVSRYSCFGTIRKCGDEALILCNLFVRADQLPSRPFPESFLCNEENWLLQSLFRKGVEMIHDPRLFVWHERRATIWQLALQTFRYGIGRGWHLRLRPHSLRAAYLIPSFCFLFGLYAVLRFLLQAAIDPLFCVFATLYIAGCLSVVISKARQKQERFSTLLVALFCFPTIHITYGIGVIIGACKRSTAHSV